MASFHNDGNHPSYEVTVPHATSIVFDYQPLYGDKIDVAVVEQIHPVPTRKVRRRVSTVGHERLDRHQMSCDDDQEKSTFLEFEKALQEAVATQVQIPQQNDTVGLHTQPKQECETTPPTKADLPPFVERVRANYKLVQREEKRKHGEQKWLSITLVSALIASTCFRSSRILVAAAVLAAPLAIVHNIEKHPMLASITRQAAYFKYNVQQMYQRYKKREHVASLCVGMLFFVYQITLERFLRLIVVMMFLTCVWIDFVADKVVQLYKFAETGRHDGGACLANASGVNGVHSVA